MIRLENVESAQDIVARMKKDHFLVFGSIWVGHPGNVLSSICVYKCERYGECETIKHPRLWDEIKNKKIIEVQEEDYYGDNKFWIVVEGFDYETEMKQTPLRPCYVEKSNDYVCPRCSGFGDRWVKEKIPNACTRCGQIFDLEERKEYGIRESKHPF